MEKWNRVISLSGIAGVLFTSVFSQLCCLGPEKWSNQELPSLSSVNEKLAWRQQTEISVPDMIACSMEQSLNKLLVHFGGKRRL